MRTHRERQRRDDRTTRNGQVGLRLIEMQTKRRSLCRGSEDTSSPPSQSFADDPSEDRTVRAVVGMLREHDRWSLSRPMSQSGSGVDATLMPIASGVTP